MNNFSLCLFDNKKLKTTKQKRIGYCNNTCLLLDLKLEILVIKQKLEAEEHELDNLAFTVNTNALEFNPGSEELDTFSNDNNDSMKEYLKKLEEELK